MDSQEPNTERTRIALLATNCACLSLRRTARLVTHFYDEKLQPTGLRVTQLPLLVVLYRAGPLTINEMAELLQLDRTTLTRNLKLLEPQGLITSEPGTDQRTRVVTLSEIGEKTLLNALPLWEAAQSQVVEQLGSGHFATLLTYLEKATALNQPER